MTLAQAYRWLLACYPRAYRRQYEDEMIGVLLDDATPGQRRPTTRDVLALLGGAFRAHVRQVGARLSVDAWREATQVLGLIAALVLFVRAARLPVLHLALLADGYPDGLGQGAVSGPAWLVSVVWLIVAMVAAFRWSRTAAAIAICAATLEVVRVVQDYAHYYTVFNLWPAVLAAMVPVALAIRAPRSARAVVAHWRLGLLATATLVSVAAPTIATVTSADRRTEAVRGTWIFTVGVGQVEAILLTAGYLLFALAVLSTPAVLRRRLLALLVPVGVTLVLTRVLLGTTGTFFERSTNDGVLGALTPAQWTTLVLAPALLFAVTVSILHHRERPGPQRA
ncbi:hypothetical protein AB0B10_23390 [Micromonospora arborensis]|uniref:hypothetical protein n=1 Tax=Micromonospora arborensis TaxID=2116518 RepID=UPI0033F9F775